MFERGPQDRNTAVGQGDLQQSLVKDITLAWLHHHQHAGVVVAVIGEHLGERLSDHRERIVRHQHARRCIGVIARECGKRSMKAMNAAGQTQVAGCDRIEFYLPQ